MASVQTRISSAGKRANAEYTDVIVVGNGPAGICLSYFLSGYTAYFNGSRHPNPYLFPKLEEKSDVPIILQDLEYLCEGLEGRSSSPVGLLFDTLTHADADLGLETPSHLRWEMDKSHAIPHVVLGKVPPGGVWQMIEGSMQTLSLGVWMELPDMSFREWKADRPCPEGQTNILRNRASMEDIRDYYTEYVQNKGLEDNFKSYCTVTSVQRVSDVLDHEDDETGELVPCGQNCQHSRHCIWEVQGYHQEGDGPKKDFCYRAPKVVLATGSFDSPNKLGVPGENMPYVLHSISELENAILNGDIGPSSEHVLVIGAGLSAADAIICSENAELPIMHVFRRKPKDPMMIFNKLPKLMYPEYHTIHRMMKGEDSSYEAYTSLAEHQVVEFMPDNKVLIRSSGSICDRIISVSAAIVLIGCRPDLSFLGQEGRNLGVVPDTLIDSKHNIMDVDAYSYQSMHEPGLFAMGPLVGDNFVRFIRGGALGITSHLLRHRKNDL